MTNHAAFIDSILKEADFSGLFVSEEKTTDGPITIWIDNDYKEKYRLLQKQTNRKFNRYLRETIEKMIDAAAKQAI
jgi:hypothetical protein